MSLTACGRATPTIGTASVDARGTVDARLRRWTRRSAQRPAVEI
jgi:hypothetical protein